MVAYFLTFIIGLAKMKNVLGDGKPLVTCIKKIPGGNLNKLFKNSRLF
jgi:hypothetical protein